MSFNFTNPLPPKPLTGYEVGKRVDPETRLHYNNGSEGKGFYQRSHRPPTRFGDRGIATKANRKGKISDARSVLVPQEQCV